MILFSGSDSSNKDEAKKKFLNKIFECEGDLDNQSLDSIRTTLLYFLREYSCFDIQISDAINYVSIQLQDIRNMYDFQECAYRAEPSCCRLQYEGLKDFYDVQLAALFIVYTNTYKSALELTDLTLAKLEEFSNEGRYDKIKFAISENLLRRMLLYKYSGIIELDSDNSIQKQEQIFMQHYKVAMDYCKEIGNKPYEAAFMLRKACFFKDKKLLQEGFKRIRGGEFKIENAIIKEVALYDLKARWSELEDD